MSNLRDWVFEQPNVTVLEETRGLDFLTAGSRVVGAVLLDNRRGRFIAVTAKATLSATGAGATMYHISSPSLEKAADGQAMAARLGAEFVDMEMMQFHPTGILAGNSIATGGLLEEGLRGAGARLYNALGERYMERYAPDKLERATRDVVSRSGYMEIMAGRGTPSGGVLIDATHIKDVAKHFAGMVDRCREYGFDLVNDRVEVSPSSHYHMGGIVHRRQLPHEHRRPLRRRRRRRRRPRREPPRRQRRRRLHRLRRPRRRHDGRSTSAVSPSAAQRPVSQRASRRDLHSAGSQPLERTAGENPFQLRDQLERMMWTKVGVVRNGKDMQEALPEIQEIRERIKSASAPSERQTARSPRPIYNAPWNEAINTENLSLIAEMLTRSALAREESRGAHYRSDFPTQNIDWLKNIRMTPLDERRLRNDVHARRVHPPHAAGTERTSRTRRPENATSHRRRVKEHTFRSVFRAMLTLSIPGLSQVLKFDVIKLRFERRLRLVELEGGVSLGSLERITESLVERFLGAAGPEQQVDDRVADS